MTSSRRPTPLKRAIFEQGMKQKELAAELRMPESRLSLLVNGLRPNANEAALIAKKLGAKEEELWPST